MFFHACPKMPFSVAQFMKDHRISQMLYSLCFSRMPKNATCGRTVHEHHCDSMHFVHGPPPQNNLFWRYFQILPDNTVEFHDFVHGPGNNGQHRAILPFCPAKLGTYPNYFLWGRRAGQNACCRTDFHELCDRKRHFWACSKNPDCTTFVTFNDLP